MTPTTVGLIGSVALRPDRVPQTVLPWLGTFLADSPGEHRLALLDTLLHSCRILEDGYAHLTGTGHSPAQTPAATTPSAADPALLAGLRDAVALLASDATALPAQNWLGYANGAIDDTQYTGAALTLLSHGADLVHQIAAVAGQDVRDMWAVLAPLLTADV